MASTKVLKEDWVEGEVAVYDWWMNKAPEYFTGDIKAKPYHGQTVVVLKAFTEPDATHDEEVLPMFLVRFPDGCEIELWADEMIGV